LRLLAAPASKPIGSGNGRTRAAGALMTSCQQPNGIRTATRCPAANPEPGAADRTTPAASMPGTYGTGTRIWY
jgi:hypothetical protein